MQADLFPEHRVSRKLRLSTEAAPTTTSAGTSHFAPNTVVSSTGVLTLIWQRYTPARPRTQPSPPPVSSFASETTVPRLWPRVPIYPGRGPRRGGDTGVALRSRAIQ